MTLTLLAKLKALNWMLVVVIFLLVGIGVVLLYSAAERNWNPWALPHLVRFGILLIPMFAIALIDIRYWFHFAYILYALSLLLLLAVPFVGHTSMGAERWINLRIITFQPSDVIKICLILALARYFHDFKRTQEIHHPVMLIVPFLLTVVPISLVVHQPNLGTALVIGLTAAAIFFVAGISWWYIGVAIAMILASLPLVWYYVLHDYHKERFLSFWGITNDPHDSGYHAEQSEIAVGSGEWLGQGFGQGIQTQLDYLPEKHTDFIFGILGEEFGFIGTMILIGLYCVFIFGGLSLSLHAQNTFSRLLSIGLVTMVFLHIAINIAMVVGFFPIVGIPLPFVSYGGTALMMMMGVSGLLLNLSIHRRITFLPH